MIQIYNTGVYFNEYSAYNKDLIYNKMYVPLFSSPFFPYFAWYKQLGRYGHLETWLNIN